MAAQIRPGKPRADAAGTAQIKQEANGVLEMADGKQETFVTPHPPGRSAAEAKDRLVEIMRTIMRERGVVRYARAAEPAKCGSPQFKIS
jgi:hypothetical protein